MNDLMTTDFVETKCMQPTWAAAYFQSVMENAKLLPLMKRLSEIPRTQLGLRMISVDSKNLLSSRRSGALYIVRLQIGYWWIRKRRNGLNSMYHSFTFLHSLIYWNCKSYMQAMQVIGIERSGTLWKWNIQNMKTIRISVHEQFNKNLRFVQYMSCNVSQT